MEVRRGSGDDGANAIENVPDFRSRFRTAAHPKIIQPRAHARGSTTIFFCKARPGRIHVGDGAVFIERGDVEVERGSNGSIEL